MHTAIVHLSDIHYRPNWDENHGVVFQAFFKDLHKQLELLKATNVYLVLSGDVVNAGHESKSYEEFLSKFDAELTPLGISKNRRICVPGNHDVSTKHIEIKRVDHEGVLSQGLNETSFNDYAENPSDVFKSKFDGYRAFESIFADYKTLSPSLTGNGWELTDNIGIYCLNSAFFSSGGLKDSNGDRLKDEGRLAINTRNLHVWNRDCKAHCKILVMHHPLNWLTKWAQQEIRTLLNNDFALCLSGHAHDQSIFHSINPGRSLVEVSAPPLFTTKKDELGYSIISLSSTNEISDITYRHWTKHHSFVAGGNFSNTEDGKVIINKPSKPIAAFQRQEPVNRDVVDDYLTKQLDEALTTFPSQPRVWVEPIISNHSEFDRNSKSEIKITVAEMISNNLRSTIIKAPPQFGLTCLAHHLAREAWRHNPASLWLCLDSRTLKPSTNTIKRVTTAKLELIGCKLEDVKCVILDSWQTDEKSSYKLLNSVCTFFNDIPIIVMQSDNNVRILNSKEAESVERNFDLLYLWTLSRGHVRTVVNGYNDVRHIGDEDAVTLKIMSDLDVLNIHRTPLNCLTMLKASEVDFDESPVNRTEMLKRVLFLLFNDDTPTYKTRPDMKDCEFVLGYFCETLIRADIYFFTQEHFVETLKTFCKNCVMALDVQRVFDILYANHILVPLGSQFCFKFTYWVYYFVAQRMHHNQDFTNFIYANMHYARFPEVIEFYTGIDRRREDALNVLIKDLKRGNASVQAMCGLPDEINPYKFIQWIPAPAEIERMRKEVREGVSASNLPETIKDQYADSGYDNRRPYHQELREILTGDSLVSLMLSTRAAARALRNSDYVVPDVKRALLTEIMNSWKQITKVLLVLSPLLVKNGQASLDGSMSFTLDDSFSSDPEECFRGILIRIPFNVVSWYKEDLFSEKMGPLLLEQFANEKDAIKKHELLLLLIAQRPSGWKEPLEKYIGAIAKNSFYLFDVLLMLRHQYAYSYAAPRELKDIEYFIKMSMVKHSVGTKNPGINAIRKVPDSVLPERTID